MKRGRPIDEFWNVPDSLELDPEAVGVVMMDAQLRFAHLKPGYKGKPYSISKSIEMGCTAAQDCQFEMTGQAHHEGPPPVEMVGGANIRRAPTNPSL